MADSAGEADRGRERLVYHPVEDLAQLAVRTLINPDPERPLDQRMPTKLVVRASSAA
jgi:DNA-binding LacI/PurR family transcriptional regulator